MTSQITNNHSVHHHDHDTEATSKVVFGFWIYIMSDCILFSCFFASYAVLHANVFGGPGPKELFDLNYVMIETFLLLTSSFTYGLAMLGATKSNKSQVHLIIEGNGPSRSAFLSSFFGLVGLHGLHVTCGLIWMALLMVQVSRRGLTAMVNRKLSCLSLFWHFLDIIWIFVFTVVYLMGVM
jgi:cytochrome o ubiquinol oxidase subunit III